MGELHMTKTEAHPYHHGRGCKVYDPSCPLCREDPAKETTYVGWSLHEATLAKAEARAADAEARVKVLETDKAKWESDKQFLLRTIESQQMRLVGIDPNTLTPKEPTDAPSIEEERESEFRQMREDHE